MTATMAVLLLGAVFLGVLVPWTSIRMLVPSLEQAHVLDNYRGRRVFLGLGAVWLVWAGCAIVGGVAAPALGLVTVLPILSIAGMLALVAFALGMLDDAYGSSASRGFRGHLAAMVSGRLTTGGLKLIGISAASLVVAAVIAQVSPWGSPEVTAGLLGRALVAGAAIALTSNLVNLTDLRPGRALKVYSLLAVFGVVSAAWMLGSSAWAAEYGVTSAQRLLDGAVLGMFMFGPVLAVWRYDVGERGMLGDAGANPMGAVAGLLVVSGLPMWALVAYALVMLALNLASERLSFSRVIEQTPALRWFDRLGRLPDEAEHRTNAKSSQHTYTKPE